jgi:hypothetical protein
MAGSHSTAARRRALLTGATPARANQHGGVCFHRARRLGPGPPSLSLWPWVAVFFFAVLCASRARRCAAQRALGILGPFSACLAAARAAWLAPPCERRHCSALAGSHAERIFF